MEGSAQKEHRGAGDGRTWAALAVLLMVNLFAWMALGLAVYGLLLKF